MTTTHGMEPAEVRALGRDLKGKADEIRHKAQWLDRLVNNVYWTGPEAVRFKSQWWPAHRARMWSMANDLEGFGQSALNNAADQERASAAESRRSLGGITVRGAGGSVGYTLPLELSRMTPAQVNDWWFSLSQEERASLISSDPGLVGNTDGIPPAVRYEANQASIAAHVARLRAEGASAEEIQKYENLAFEPSAEHGILVFAPWGDGRIAEVFGNIVSAEDVAVVVPGVGNDLDGYSPANAESLRSVGDGDTATIMWLGYDTPSGMEIGAITDPSAISAARAKQWAPKLAEFTSGLRATTTGEISVVAHSYGTVLTTEAARVGLDVDSVVLLGSPGVGADTAAVFGEGTEVFAIKNEGDPITMGSPHGTDPTSPEFGARVLPGNRSSDTDGAFEPHSTYFDGGSVALQGIIGAVEGRIDATPGGYAYDPAGGGGGGGGW